jgi:hypothetical protein
MNECMNKTNKHLKEGRHKGRKERRKTTVNQSVKINK